ncbi:hypothetical protein [Massilia niabensis]|uniref:Uncharacterized protein n=1 Tax=Massilia niabensis TaxID=544910 RepID=A0ABW0L7X3_9BURK
MLCLTLAARADPAPAVPALAPPGPQAAPAGETLPLRVRLDRDAIRAAIAGLPEEKDPDSRRHQTDLLNDTLSATPLKGFSHDFAKARLPVCLHSEGLRNQPTFFLSGWIALPFVAVAKLRGVCR